MADEVKYSRVIVRDGSLVIGVDADGNETVLYETDIPPRATEQADYYAWTSGVDIEFE